jgi:ABC-type branched-subunit amino acid transport system ATPase component
LIFRRFTSLHSDGSTNVEKGTKVMLIGKDGRWKTLLSFFSFHKSHKTELFPRRNKELARRGIEPAWEVRVLFTKKAHVLHRRFAKKRTDWTKKKEHYRLCHIFTIRSNVENAGGGSMEGRVWGQSKKEWGNKFLKFSLGGVCRRKE